MNATDSLWNGDCRRKEWGDIASVQNRQDRSVKVVMVVDQGAYDPDALEMD